MRVTELCSITRTIRTCTSSRVQHAYAATYVRVFFACACMMRAGTVYCCCWCSNVTSAAVRALPPVSNIRTQLCTCIFFGYEHFTYTVVAAVLRRALLRCCCCCCCCCCCFAAAPAVLHIPYQNGSGPNSPMTSSRGLLYRQRQPVYHAACRDEYRPGSQLTNWKHRNEIH